MTQSTYETPAVLNIDALSRRSLLVWELRTDRFRDRDLHPAF